MADLKSSPPTAPPMPRSTTDMFGDPIDGLRNPPSSNLISTPSPTSPISVPSSLSNPSDPISNLISRPSSTSSSSSSTATMPTSLTSAPSSSTLTVPLGDTCPTHRDLREDIDVPWGRGGLALGQRRPRPKRF